VKKKFRVGDCVCWRMELEDGPAPGPFYYGHLICHDDTTAVVANPWRVEEGKNTRQGTITFVGMEMLWLGGRPTKPGKKLLAEMRAAASEIQELRQSKRRRAPSA
jgi:hypothetical protein